MLGWPGSELVNAGLICDHQLTTARALVLAQLHSLALILDLLKRKAPTSLPRPSFLIRSETVP